MYCKKMAVKWTTYSAGVHDYYRATIIEAAFHKLGILTKAILEGKGSYMKEKKLSFTQQSCQPIKQTHVGFLYK